MGLNRFQNEKTPFQNAKFHPAITPLFRLVVMSTAISSVTGPDAAQTAAAANQTLTQANFLQLLVTQMSS